MLNHLGIAKAQYAKLLSEQRSVLAFVEEWRKHHACDFMFFRPHQVETEATTVSDASLSEETWSRIKQLEKDGAKPTLLDPLEVGAPLLAQPLHFMVSIFKISYHYMVPFS